MQKSDISVRCENVFICLPFNYLGCDVRRGLQLFVNMNCKITSKTKTREDFNTPVDYSVFRRRANYPAKTRKAGRSLGKNPCRRKNRAYFVMHPRSSANHYFILIYLHFAKRIEKTTLNQSAIISDGDLRKI